MSMSLPDSAPAEVILTRITPALVTIRVEYNPDNPLRVSEWQNALGAALVINGGFFREDNTTAGLLIHEGEAHGFSFDQIEAAGYEHGGMLGITGGVPSVRLLSTSPYVEGESLDFALQGLPMLIDQGVPVDFHLPERPARRTAVATDSQGRLVLLTVATDSITLMQLRDWIASTSELAIIEAMGLDGGPSTGLAIQAGAINVSRDSWTPVPSVLAIFTK
jgi:exopolysaccharide biosynthesis protein